MDSGWREADTPSLTGKGLRQRLTACEFKLSDIVVFVDFTLAPFLVLMKTQMAESTQDIVTCATLLWPISLGRHGGRKVQIWDWEPARNRGG